MTIAHTAHTTPQDAAPLGAGPRACHNTAGAPVTAGATTPAQRETIRRRGRIAALQQELADIAADRALAVQMRHPRGLLTALDADETKTWAHLAELATSHADTSEQRRAA
jgi:hypothetical protein